jgi:2-dehydro-3-deoxygluconokinase
VKSEQNADVPLSETSHAGQSGVDVVTIGESMVLFQPLQEGPLSYAPLFTRSVGGAESNVAIALARLGKTTRWVSRLGRDPFGDIIASTLAGEGVDISFVQRDATASTAVFFRENRGHGDPSVFYYRQGSAASRMTPADVRPEWMADARHLHVTGITPALGPDTRETVASAMRLARELGLTVSFDPNLRRKLWDESTARETLLSLVPLCDVFLPGIEEAEFLAGARAPEELGAFFRDMGPAVVALKLGAEGSLGFVRDGSVHAPPHVVHRVLDSVGAGDAFAAGFLSVLLDSNTLLSLAPETLQRALQHANIMGAMATQFRGDWEALPTWAQLENIISGQSEVTR